MSNVSYHQYSPKIAELFTKIGEYDFFNSIESQPWSSRNRVIAKQIVYQKYITPEDIVKAYWHQLEAKKVDPSWHSDGAGAGYIKELLAERSNGRWNDEISELMKDMPTVMEYASAFYKEHPLLSDQEAAVAPPPRPKLVVIDGREAANTPPAPSEAPDEEEEPSSTDAPR